MLFFGALQHTTLDAADGPQARWAKHEQTPFCNGRARSLAARAQCRSDPAEEEQAPTTDTYLIQKCARSTGARATEQKKNCGSRPRQRKPKEAEQNLCTSPNLQNGRKLLRAAAHPGQETGASPKGSECRGGEISPHGPGLSSGPGSLCWMYANITKVLPVTTGQTSLLNRQQTQGLDRRRPGRVPDAPP